MLTKYKNAFLTAIEEAGLDPSLFEAEEDGKDEPNPIYPVETDGQPIFIIRLKNSPLQFMVREVATTFHEFSYRSSFYTPDFTLGFWYRDKDAADVLVEFKEWLEYAAKKYIEDNNLPDYWSQLKAYGSLVLDSDLPDEEDGEFTEEEKEDVRDSVKRLRAMIAEEFKPTLPQSEFINERLDYLSKAVDRLNRFDWKGVAISIVMSIAVNLSVDTERGRVLYALFKTAFQGTTKLLHP